MIKKNFRDTGADLFFSEDSKVDIQNTLNAQDTQIEENKNKEKYRFNLKLDIELKEYIQEVAWLDHMTITEYFNNLIRADKEKRENR